MSKNENPFDNPFKSLDKKQYRELKENKKEIKKPIKEERLPTQDFDNDEDLFLHTMNNVRNIKNPDKYTGKDTDSSKTLKESLAKKENKEKNTMQNAFADLLPKDTAKKSNKKQLKTESLTQLGENFASGKKTEKQEYTGIDEYDFYNALQDVKPLDGKERIAPPEPEKIIVQQDQSPLIYDFEEGKLEFALTENNDHVQCNILGLDILTLGKLQQRHYNPEAHIDLHKMNAYEAFHALIGFFKNAFYRDMRCLLIVTGKGLNSFDNRPLLRSKVCDWLIQSPFKHLTLAFCTAKQEDGGSGALYVLIRKRRKNSPAIPWERLPNDYDLWADLDK